MKRRTLLDDIADERSADAAAYRKECARLERARRGVTVARCSACRKEKLVVFTRRPLKYLCIACAEARRLA